MKNGRNVGEKNFSKLERCCLCGVGARESFGRYLDV